MTFTTVFILSVNQIFSGNPDLIDGQLAKKDELLGNRLKQIYVTSRDKPIIPKNIEKTLPAERNNVESPEFGYQEPARITKGKLSIRQALLLIGKHHQDPVIHNAVSLANEYTIHPRVSGTESNGLTDNHQTEVLFLQRIF